MRTFPSIANNRGFSLIEMLVALVIMSLSLGVLYQAAAAATNNVGVAGQYTEAIILAESVLAENSYIVTEEVTLNGVFADYSWELISWPLPQATIPLPEGVAEGDLPILGVPLQFLKVRVLWSSQSAGREVELLTIVPLREGEP